MEQNKNLAEFFEVINQIEEIRKICIKKMERVPDFSIKSLFSYFGQQNPSSISKACFIDQLSKLTDTLNRHKIEAIFKSLDQDSDGVLGITDFYRFFRFSFVNNNPSPQENLHSLNSKLTIELVMMLEGLLLGEKELKINIRRYSLKNSVKFAKSAFDLLDPDHRGYFELKDVQRVCNGSMRRDPNQRLFENVSLYISGSMMDKLYSRDWFSFFKRLFNEEIDEIDEEENQARSIKRTSTDKKRKESNLRVVQTDRKEAHAKEFLPSSRAEKLQRSHKIGGGLVANDENKYFSFGPNIQNNLKFANRNNGDSKNDKKDHQKISRNENSENQISQVKISTNKSKIMNSSNTNRDDSNNKIKETQKIETKFNDKNKVTTTQDTTTNNISNSSSSSHRKGREDINLDILEKKLMQEPQERKRGDRRGPVLEEIRLEEREEEGIKRWMGPSYELKETLLTNLTERSYSDREDSEEDQGFSSSAAMQSNAYESYRNKTLEIDNLIQNLFSRKDFSIDDLFWQMKNSLATKKTYSDHQEFIKNPQSLKLLVEATYDSFTIFLKNFETLRLERHEIQALIKLMKEIEPNNINFEIFRSIIGRKEDQDVAQPQKTSRIPKTKYVLDYSDYSWRTKIIIESLFKELAEFAVEDEEFRLVLKQEMGGSQLKNQSESSINYTNAAKRGEDQGYKISAEEEEGKFYEIDKISSSPLKNERLRDDIRRHLDFSGA